MRYRLWLLSNFIATTLSGSRCCLHAVLALNQQFLVIAEDLLMKQIRSMSFEELVTIRAEVEAAIALHVARERKVLMEMLETLGSTRGQASRGTGIHPLKGRKVLPKYRNPDDHSQVWAGRGNKPRWLAAALKKRGVKLESFAIE